MSSNGSGPTDQSVPVPERIIRDQPLKVLPKRFFKAVEVARSDAGFVLLLDGRTAKTPFKRALAVPSDALGESVAAEWQAQGTHINPATMPLTRLVTTAIDAVAGQEQAVAEEIARYAMSDLLSYRADGPEELVQRQRAQWDGPLAWAERTYGVEIKRSTGILHVAQDLRLAEAITQQIATRPALELSALHVLTTITGSAVLALARRAERLSFDELWNAAHVDEDHQIALWGRDDEAEARRAQRLADSRAADLVLTDFRSLSDRASD